jgi:NADH-quinone oxidoreductase subunit E
VEFAKIDRILRRYRNQKSYLISILHDVQTEYNYLPKESLEKIAEKIGVPLSRVYSTATFFKAFSLEPRGKHLITVCLGTACHVRGAPRIVEEIERILGIKPGETTKDKNFTFETVNCLGCCAIGPIMVVDNKYFGEITTAKIASVLKSYEKS